jgi:tripartite-type tricarboxylate transporter receptor subunit TctC
MELQVKVVVAVRQCCTTLFMLVALLTPSFAQDWPTRPVTIVAPYAPGGNTDLMARLLAAWLGEKLGRPFVVENRAGGGGAIGTGNAARATPDGYTFLFTGAVQTIILPMLQKVSYDTDRDFVPISIFGDGNYVLGIKSSLPAKTFPEFIAYAKANPGKLNYGSVGPGGVIHLATALLAARMGLDMVHIPFNGAQARGGLVAGTIDVYMGTNAELLTQDGVGQVRLIATGTPKRIPQRPDLPAIAEFLPGFHAHSPNGFYAPRGTPQAIVDRMSELTMEAVRDPVIRKKLDDIGIEPLGTNPAETRAMIEADKKAYRDAVIAAGLLKE